MKFEQTLKDGKWWDMDGRCESAHSGETLEEARENLIGTIRMMQEPVDLAQLPKNKLWSKK